MKQTGHTGIRVYNRQRGCIEEEKVFERNFMDLFYGTVIGRLITGALLSRTCISKGYGWLQKRPRTVRHILPFVEEFNIDTDEIEKPLGHYKNFNEFFKRRLKPDARPVNMTEDALISPADGRLITYTVRDDLIIPVKGTRFTISELLGGEEDTKPWKNGTCIKIRLAPYDYHRFCYIDNGSHGPVVPIRGRLHSVSPLALRHGLKILQANKREFAVLSTENFGRVVHIDVGAMAVGSIHQHLRNGGKFSRGDEKGYFEFGGSTIILLFAPGIVMMDEDIRNYSHKGIETLVRYGSKIGQRTGRP